MAVLIAAASATPMIFAINSSRGCAAWIAPKKLSNAGDSVSIAGSTRSLTALLKVVTPELIALKTLSACRRPQIVFEYAGEPADDFVDT